MTSGTPVFIACSVFRREIEQILHDDYPEAATIFPDSMLHMHPEQLRETLEAEISAYAGEPIVLVYGDCHAYMQETCRRNQCTRTDGINCCDLLLGHDRYRQMQRENVFIFLPEWTERWHEVFGNELGLRDRHEAGLFMREMRSGLVYLDTGIVPPPEATLREIEHYFSMPVSVLSVSLEPLRAAVRAAAERVLDA